MYLDFVQMMEWHEEEQQKSNRNVLILVLNIYNILQYK